MSSSSHLREVKKLAAEHGLVVEVGHHLKLRNASGGLVAVASLSPSDHRGLKNLRSSLRRAMSVDMGGRVRGF